MAESFDIVIEPGTGMRRYWADLWQYRGLMYFLVWRDVLVRYKQTVIGVAWSVIRPLATMVVLTFVFGRLARLPSGDAPYPVLVFAALLPWQLFASAVGESSQSLVSNANMLRKIYFPRLIVPVSAAAVSLVDFLVAFGILGALMAFYGHPVTWRFLTLPAFLVLALVAAIGPGIWLAALNVRYRDFRHVVPFLIQFGLYISPVGFDSAVVPDRWRLLYSLNPMVGVIDGFRWAILGGDVRIYLPGFALSAFLSLGILFTALAYFRRTERSFADVV